MKIVEGKRNLGCTILIVAILFVVGGIVYRVNSGESAMERLNRLAQLPPETAYDLSAARLALLRRIPVGTSEQAIYAVLEQSGAIRQDRAPVTPLPVITPDPKATFPAYIAQLPAAQWGPLTYYPKDAVGTIHCFIYGDRFGVGVDLLYVRFWLDTQGTLQDITIRDDSRSL